MNIFKLKTNIKLSAYILYLVGAIIIVLVVIALFKINFKEGEYKFSNTIFTLLSISWLLLPFLILTIIGIVLIFKTKLKNKWKWILVSSWLVVPIFLFVVFTNFSKINNDKEKELKTNEIQIFLKYIKFHSLIIFIVLIIFINLIIINAILEIPAIKQTYIYKTLNWISSLFIFISGFVLLQSYFLMIFYSKFLSKNSYKKLKLWSQIPFINSILWMKKLNNFYY